MDALLTALLLLQLSVAAPSCPSRPHPPPVAQQDADIDLIRTRLLADVLSTNARTTSAEATSSSRTPIIAAAEAEARQRRQVHWGVRLHRHGQRREVRAEARVAAAASC